MSPAGKSLRFASCMRARGGRIVRSGQKVEGRLAPLSLFPFSPAAFLNVLVLIPYCLDAKSRCTFWIFFATFSPASLRTFSLAAFFNVLVLIPYCFDGKSCCMFGRFFLPFVSFS